MFKKSTPLPLPSNIEESLNSHRFTADLVSNLNPHGIIEDALELEAETTIAQGVSIKGVLRFERLVRIDGFFEGEIESSGTLIIGPTGVVISDLHLEEAFISGKVKGNITVKKQLSLRGRAEVEGDIRAPLLSVDEGVSLKGNLQIAPFGAVIDEPDYDEDHYLSDN